MNDVRIKELDKTIYHDEIEHIIKLYRLQVIRNGEFLVNEDLSVNELREIITRSSELGLESF